MKIIKRIALLVLLTATSFRVLALDYPPSLTNEIDGRVIDDSTRDLVVFIHGWNPFDHPDGYAVCDDVAGHHWQWAYLRNTMVSRLTGTTWKLALYHWEEDAHTGFIDFDPFEGLVPNAINAANNAKAHGTHLGTLLANTCPQLHRVHFIAHSAGAWAAREATREVLSRLPNVTVQTTFLDPFIPDALIYGTGLSTNLMSQTVALPGASRIYRMENYYSAWFPLDPTGTWTSQRFSWRTNRDINQQVDYTCALPLNPYTGHDGPIEFYADTVAASQGGPSIPDGLWGGLWGDPPFDDFLKIGWYRSMAFEAPVFPRITTDLEDLTIMVGETATFVVAATGTPLNYSWYLNDSPISGAVGTSLNATAAGQYRVVVQYANGYRTQSRIATLTVNSVASPVTLTAPSAGAVLSGTSTVTANAPDATSVEFWEDGVRQYTDLSAPFSWAWDTTSISDGFHQIVAKAYSGTTLLGFTTPRSVTVANQAPYEGSDPYEPNDRSSLATPISFGSTLLAYIDSPTDVDWFRVNVTAAGTLLLNLSVPDGKDYDVELYGPDGLWMMGSYLSAGVDEAILQPVTETGTYYCRVYGCPVGAGSFSETVPYALTSYFTNSGSGPPPGSTVWSGTVDVTGDVTIAVGETLTILPGTDVRFHTGDANASGTDLNRTEIILNGGTLNATGTAGAPVVFTSAGPTKSPGDWFGIRVVAGDVTLNHCVVEYAVQGIRFECADTRLSNY
ncbi:MAG: Ig-like domain-containing protein, partial [Verrucomicrobia bacterium]|nr:Ig-like domain-containing protein [Verrucomicrobiota bacterium]